MSLEAARAQIDQIDHQLISLLNQRAGLVHEIGRIKKKDGLDIYVPGREEKLLRKLVEINAAQHGQLTERAIRAIFREIMSAALALENSMKIAYLGPAGSWTHQVAITKFGNSVEYVPEASTEGVFTRVASHQVDYSVLPIEHSTEGAVHHTLDHLVESPLQIYAQIQWKLETVVMAREEAAALRRIYGHPQMLAHCRSWLGHALPLAQLIETATAAEAASRAETEAAAGALGTPLAAELHGLRAVATSPRDLATRARFIILGRRSGAPSGQDNTMLMVHARDRVGALLEVLQIFAAQDINVRQIENRPVPGDSTGTQARFFLEVSGHREDQVLSAAASDLEKLGATVKFLGSYPACQWVEER